ncbi:MAG: DUF4269 domain-containing protein [Mucilaginibacter polytrichastri]|nr:DUF4269 domain-containing protein [Mucilaginibacter polytrichastri]
MGEKGIIFPDLSELKTGTPRQKAAYVALTGNRIMEKLAPWTPVLAGTIPLNIDREESDLDILCCADDLPDFREHIGKVFGHHAGFSVFERTAQNEPAVVARFICDGFPVELFAQRIPVSRQYAFRHLLIERELLKIHGEDFRRHITALKKSGLKTEAAFAQLLGITGDPYEQLLVYGADKLDIR